MKALLTFKKWLVGGCVWYAVLSLGMLLAEKMIGSENLAVNANSFLLMFPFGLSVSGGSLLLKNEKIARWVRWLSHYGITVAAFFLFILLPTGISLSPAAILLLTVFLSALYWLLFFLVHIFQKRFKRLLEED